MLTATVNSVGNDGADAEGGAGAGFGAPADMAAGAGAGAGSRNGVTASGTGTLRESLMHSCSRSISAGVLRQNEESSLNWNQIVTPISESVRIQYVQIQV